MSEPRAQTLQRQLGLDDDELIRTLDASALELLAGELDHRPELTILQALVAEIEDPRLLRQWVRAAGPDGRRPVDLLTARDFRAFEDALARFRERGLVVRARRAR